MSPDLLHASTLVAIIAELAHEMNRTYCRSIGDESQPRWDHAPDWQKESAKLGVVAVMQDPEMTPKKSHDVWMEHKASEGWVYGKEKNPNMKTHPCMVDYEMLPKSQRIKDIIFITTVQTMLLDAEIPRMN